MQVLYLDESGDHNLLKIDPQYPVFVLGGVIVDEDYVNAVVREALNDLKVRFFGSTDFVLHTADIVRAKGVFTPLADRELREAFSTDLSGVMASLNYTVVACAIRKDRFVQHYSSLNDPYLLSFHHLVDRFCAEVGARALGGRIVAERRRAVEDEALELEWQRLRLRGTDQSSAATIVRRLASPRLHDKRDRLPGLELADLVVSPIGRHVLGKPDRPDWEVVRQKFLCGPDGEIEGWGLVQLPKGQE